MVSVRLSHTRSPSRAPGIGSRVINRSPKPSGRVTIAILSIRNAKMITYVSPFSAPYRNNMAKLTIALTLATYRQVHRYTGAQRPLIGMCGKPASRPAKARERTRPEAVGRMFDPYGAEPQSTNAAAAQGASARARSDCGPLMRSVARGWAGIPLAGCPGHAVAAVSAGGHGPAVISLSW